MNLTWIRIRLSKKKSGYRLHNFVFFCKCLNNWNIIGIKAWWWIQVEFTRNRIRLSRKITDPDPLFKRGRVRIRPFKKQPDPDPQPYCHIGAGMPLPPSRCLPSSGLFKRNITSQQRDRDIAEELFMSYWMTQKYQHNRIDRKAIKLRLNSFSWNIWHNLRHLRLLEKCFFSY